MLKLVLSNDIGFKVLQELWQYDIPLQDIVVKNSFRKLYCNPNIIYILERL
jgi:hypothetical protein